jgi:hypothetical protein
VKNKNVGYLIVGISVIIGIIVLIFNNALKTIVSTSCTHGPICPMWGTISTQSWISLSLAGLVFVIGLFFIFAKENEKIIVKRINNSVKQENRLKITQKKFNEEELKLLDKDEKTIVELIIKENGTMFQSDIVDKTGFNKVKVTRILDGLEGRGLIERKRRGLSNIIILDRKNN